MVGKKIALSLLAVPISLGIASAAIYFPRGQYEKQIRSLTSSKNWDHCDQTDFNHKLLTAKIMDRLEPYLAWQEKRLRNEALNRGGLHLLDHNSQISQMEILSWQKLFRKATHWKKFLRPSALVETRLLFKELLLWDKNRLAPEGLTPVNQKKWTFKTHSAVKFTSPNAAVILLDIGDFPQFQNEFTAIIERAWSVGAYKLKVEWVKANPNAYRFRADPYQLFHHVDHTNKTISLLERAEPGIVAHEIGHVLGFADHYQIYWDYKLCELRESVYEHDLMANSNQPRALSGHWLIMQQAYQMANFTEAKFNYRSLDVFREENEIPPRLTKITNQNQASLN